MVFGPNQEVVSPRSLVWRDDDIGAGTVGVRLDRLIQVDDLLQRYGVPHTIALLAAGLYPTHPVVSAIRSRKMLVQLHGWTHDAMTTQAAVAKLPLAVSLISDLFGAPPTVIYPPWNRTSEWLYRQADELGLVVSYRKTSLPAFIRSQTCETGVLNFHYWSTDDRSDLARALEVAHEDH